MKAQLDLHQQLSSIPGINQGVDVKEKGDSLVVTVKLVYPGWTAPLRKLLKPRKRKSYELEGLGREIYESIDGRRTFEQLIDLFAERHALTFFESRALIMQYMKTLMERGLVVVGVVAGE